MEMEVVWEGMLAGYGIAIPVGAIAILIIDAGLKRGLFVGLMAGAGAAAADLLYASVAAVGGSLLASALSPYDTLLRSASALLLLAIGGYGLWRTRLAAVEVETVAASKNGTGSARTFFQFLGLTLLNPTTVAYFTALIVGSETLSSLGSQQRLTFAMAAGTASLSWQSLLALIGAMAGKRMTPRLQRGVSTIGNLVVLGLALRILWQLLS